MLHPDFERVLISREEIDARVRELAAELDRDYAGKNPLFITILKGSVFFFTDLLQNLTIPAEFDFMSVSSYGSGTVGGRVRILKDHDIPAEGEYRVVIGANSGRTLSFHWYHTDKLTNSKLVRLATEAAMAHAGMDQEAFESKFTDGYVHHYNRDTTTCLVLIYTHTADQPDGDSHVYQGIVNYQTGEVVKLEYTDGVG